MRASDHSILHVAVLYLFVQTAMAADCCAVFSPDPIPTLFPNQSVPVAITLRNDGASTWAANGGIILSFQVLNSQFSTMEYGPATLIPTSVTTGQSVRLTVPVKAPKNPGSYSLRWFVSVLDDSREWYDLQFAPTAEALNVIPSTFNLKTLFSLVAGYQHTHPDPRSQVAVLDPFITSMGLNPNNELPAQVGLSGDHFGSTTLGQLNLKFPDKVVSALVYVWTDTALYGLFDVSGELDQPATVQVVRSDGATSNEWPVMFTATKDFLPVPADRIVAQCAGNTYTFDQCEISHGPPADHWTAFHQSNCCVTGDSGTDSYSLPLLHNGWEYEALYVDEPGIEKHTSVSGFTTGSGAPQSVNVHWSVPLHENIFYGLRVFMRGPRGIPSN